MVRFGGSPDTTAEQTRNPDGKKEKPDFDRLNEAFSKGESVIDHVEELRKIDKPVLVDLDGTMWSGATDDRKINPDALDFLNKIKESGGTVIFCSIGNIDGYQFRLDLLKEMGLWSENSILILKDSWKDICQKTSSFNEESIPGLSQLLDYFSEIAQNNGWKFDRKRYLMQSPVAKDLSIVFGKNFKIPVIDDTPKEGYGTVLFDVKAFDSSLERDSLEFEFEYTENGSDLADITPQVVEYLNSI